MKKPTIKFSLFGGQTTTGNTIRLESYEEKINQSYAEGKMDKSDDAKTMKVKIT